MPPSTLVKIRGAHANRCAGADSPDGGGTGSSSSIRHRRAARRRRHGGFALTVTLMLMVLLALLAIGLMGLSSVTLRASAQSLAITEARQNARLAMQLAIGQLQLLTGHDTRVTASSQFVDPSGPLQTGAWRSWEGSDHDGAGRPLAPNYAAKKQVSVTAAEPDKRFLGWLTSAGIGSPVSVTPPFSNLAKVPQADYVAMVGAGSVKDSAQYVYLKPTMISGKGAMGWWTSGENAKAMVNLEGPSKPTTLADWQERTKASGFADPNVFKLGALDQLDPARVIATTKSLQLVDPAVVVRGFHDLTAYNRGLLTNTATGGWRKDLSLMTEAYGKLPGSGLPFFTLKPGVDQNYNKAPVAVSGSAPAGSLLYSWANYRGTLDQKAKWQTPAIGSWDALVDYTQQYKALTSADAGKTAMPAAVPNCDGAKYRLNYQDRARRVPQIARLQIVYSLNSKIYQGDTIPMLTKGQYQPGILFTPVLTLWNPYNVELTVNNYAIDTYFHAPLAFKFQIGPYTSYASVGFVTGEDTGSVTGSPSIVQKLVSLQIPEAFTLPPGGSMVFGMKTIETVGYHHNDGYHDVMTLSPGYSPRKGKLFHNIGGAGLVRTFPAGTLFKMANITCHQWMFENGNNQIEGIVCRDEKYVFNVSMYCGFGMYYTILANTTPLANGTLKLYNNNAGDYGANIFGTHRMIYDYFNMSPTGYAKINSMADIYPDFSVPVSPLIDEVEGENSRPFAMSALTTRMASSLAPARDHKSLYAKGMLQANPLSVNCEVGGVFDEQRAATTMAGSGVFHPVNAPVAMDFYHVDGWNDTNLPQREPGTNSGYVVSGQDVSDGLTRCIMAEVPTRPLQSLAELQHFDARNNNPVPPFSFNLIGNSSAQPLIAPNAVSIPTLNQDNMCNDDSYCLNHLLFDDWFFSSIAGDVKDFQATTERTQEQVYKDHLSLGKPLPNRRYLPAKAALGVTPAAAYAADVVPPDSYQKIGSQLEVDGMFNINSVSLDAWKAILRQTRSSKVARMAADGSTQLDATASGYPYPRTTIAGDVACNPTSSSVGAPGLAEYAGYRCLTDVQVDALAVEIVKEIRKRGPFLSLSEFTNRQIINDAGTTSLALAGPVQQALDTLANLYKTSPSNAKNPFSMLQSTSIVIQTPPGTTDYKFPNAAKGWSAFGMPGWIRQADILRPLAPTMSARDDTFTIRAYGDSRSASDSSQVLARAWCEFTVKRCAAYVDAANAPTVAPLPTKLSPANKLCGRKYEVVSFRWLSKEEI